MALCREALHAPDDVAVVGFLTGMNSHVGFQVSFLVESALASRLGTDIVLAPHMRLDVHLQALGSAV